MIRRINLFAGPGAGKSTNASRLFSHLKDTYLATDYTIELIHEYVKTWAWEGRKPKNFDQFYIFAKQMRRETIFLQNGGSLLVTDSPLLLSAYYAKQNGVLFSDQIISIVREIDAIFPPLNIMLMRNDRHYDPKGRFESYEQALEADSKIYDMISLEYGSDTIVKSTAATLFNDVDTAINLF